MFNNPKTANSFGINSSEGKQKALFLVLERGREAKTVVCISRPWGAYVRQQPFCPRPCKGAQTSVA